MVESSFIDQIDNTWTLFLDRDGVLNHEKKDDYIRNANEFVFYDGIIEALKKANARFGKIILVTNQRGIGRGLMTHDDLKTIHDFMLLQINEQGGRIDSMYYAPDLDKNGPDRKPNIGMGLKAKHDHPTIDFNKSIMVGNNLSDMEFGKRLGMKTVFVETTKQIEDPNELIDLKFDSLPDFFDLL